MTIIHALVAVMLYAHAQTLTQPYRDVADVKAEIQIYINMRPDPKNPKGFLYDQRWVSSPRQIVPADRLYPNEFARDGICFYGDPEGALKLFKVMAENMGFAFKTTTDGHVFEEPTHGKPWLQIEGVNADGKHFPWFDRVRRCDHPATETDFTNTPRMNILPPFASSSPSHRPFGPARAQDQGQ